MMTEIVRTSGVLGGFPRLAGRRIGVHHVVGQFESCCDETEVAERLAIDNDEVRAAIEYAEAHPEVMAEIEREREKSLEHVTEQAEYPEGVSPS